MSQTTIDTWKKLSMITHINTSRSCHEWGWKDTKYYCINEILRNEFFFILPKILPWEVYQHLFETLDLLKVRLITSKNLLRLAEKLMIKTYQLEFHMNKNYIRACILFVNLFQKLHQSQITLSRLSKLQGFQKWRCSKIYNLTVKFFLVPPYLVLLALQHSNYQRLLTSSEMLVFF